MKAEKLAEKMKGRIILIIILRRSNPSIGKEDASTPMAPIMLQVLRGKVQLSKDVSSSASSLCPTSFVPSPLENLESEQE